MRKCMLTAALPNSLGNTFSVTGLIKRVRIDYHLSIYTPADRFSLKVYGHF